MTTELASGIFAVLLLVIGWIFTMLTGRLKKNETSVDAERKEREAAILDLRKETDSKLGDMRKSSSSVMQIIQADHKGLAERLERIGTLANETAERNKDVGVIVKEIQADMAQRNESWAKEQGEQNLLIQKALDTANAALEYIKDTKRV